MPESIAYSTPAYGHRRHHLSYAGLGTLTLYDGRLTWCDLAGVPRFDRRLDDVVVEPAKHDRPGFGVRASDGESWSFGFRAADKERPRDPADNPFGVRVADVDVTDAWAARDVTESWLRILADPTHPDPAAWDPRRDGP